MSAALPVLSAFFSLVSMVDSFLCLQVQLAFLLAQESLMDFDRVMMKAVKTQLALILAF